KRSNVPAATGDGVSCGPQCPKLTATLRSFLPASPPFPWPLWPSCASSPFLSENPLTIGAASPAVTTDVTKSRRFIGSPLLVVSAQICTDTGAYASSAVRSKPAESAFSREVPAGILILGSSGHDAQTAGVSQYRLLRKELGDEQ